MIAIHPVPCLADNYAYLVIDEARRAVVVDPSEAAPVLRALRESAAHLEQVWLTHHHWDHIGGVEELVGCFASLEVRASVHDLEHARISGQTHVAREGETFAFGERRVEVLDVPGHTLGAVAYLIDGNVFTGDTLFLGGCGRVFEGTMARMQESLGKLRGLPDDTRVWCGHEYTVRNLEFAQTVEPSNSEIEVRRQRALSCRALGQPTVPGTLREERATNPFLRWDVAAISLGHDAVTSFTRVREMKDLF